MYVSKIQKQLEELKKEIDLLKNQDFRLELAKLKTEILSLRGLVNRKIGFDNPESSTKRTKSPDGLDNLRY